MKKFFSLLITLAFTVGLFVGCGYTAGTGVTGIAFTSDVYYVDYNVETRLDYKILPSTASAFNPQITLVGDDLLLSGIEKINNDTIKVVDQNFDHVEVQIKYSTGSGVVYGDSCEVRLKKYPEAITTRDDTVYVSSKGITQVEYLGNFGENDLRTMDNSYYKTRVTSSDETVITVESQDNVVVKSTGKQGKAKITIEVVASDGSKIGASGLQTSVDVVVTNSVSNCTMLASYTDELSGETNAKIYRNLAAGNTTFEFTNTTKCYTIEPILLDDEGYIVENVGYNVVSLNDNVVTVTDNKNGTFSINLVGEGETEVLISSNGYGDNGEIVIFKLKCTTNNMA